MPDEPKHEVGIRKDLRERLNRLNRKPLTPKRAPRSPVDGVRQSMRKQKEAQAKPKPEEAIVYRRDLPRQAPPPLSVGQDRERSVVLEEAVDGVQVDSPKGRGFIITSRATELDQMETVSDAFKMQMTSDGSNLRKRIARAFDADDFVLSDFIFMDIETTGLGNSPLFLIGIMVWEGDGFEVQQYLARNYAEEAAVISFFIDICAGKRLLVTFNGKSYDFPYIRTRAVSNGIPFRLSPAHFDMLHECRRIWKSDLPDCKLQTLETYICGQPRHGDIPGAQIPDAYHAYVRTDNAWQIVEVLKHNLLDLVTMADLMTRFPEPEPQATGLGASYS